MSKEYATVWAGEARALNLVATDSDNTPLDLSTASGTTELEVRLPLAAGGFLSKKLSLSQVILTNLGAGGRYSILLTTAETLTLKVSARQDFYAYWTKTAGQPRVIYYPGMLTVKTPAF